MYVITDDLKNMGFSFNSVTALLARNQDQKMFTTLQYFCIWIVQSDLTLTVSKKTYQVAAGNMIFIGPQKKFEIVSGNPAQIHIIAFSSAFYERSAKDSLLLHSELFLNSDEEIFICPFQNLQEMKIIFIERILQFQQKNEGLYISAARNAVERLILDGLLCLPEKEERSEDRLDDVSYVNRFKVLLQKDFVTQKKVSYYADALRVTPRKLSKMTELVTGLSAKQLIIDKIIREYYKLLKFGNLTFSQMTYELGFSEESNFSNFIKTHTGKKPSDTRTEVNLE